MIRGKLQSFSSEQQDKIVNWLVPDIADTVLHHLLWTLEQTECVQIGISLENQDVKDLKQVSDGLAGELYSKEGWIARFSKEPSTFKAE